MCRFVCSMTGTEKQKFRKMQSSSLDTFIRGRHGGVEKGGGWKTSRMTPLPKRGFGPPLVRYVFHPPQVSVLCFPVQKSTTEQTRSCFGGVQKFSGERVLWYVFPPPYVLHPPISRPNFISATDRHPSKTAHSDRTPCKGSTFGSILGQLLVNFGQK